jgi:peptidoglycan/xylan/chitin deacetylase (PgdA/CDA1 family)
MRIRGIGRFRRIAQPYTNRFLPGAIILAYHRVADLASDPQLLCVTPEHFAEHLEVLREKGYPIRLQELGLSLRDRKKLPRGTAVTFDDGYADNLINAKPILERYDVPATVFVTAGYVDQQRDFWWDELESLLLHRDPLPKTLRLQIDGRVHEWDLSLPENCNGTTHGQQRRWNISERSDPTARHSAYRSLHKLLRPLAENDQRRALDELRAWAGLGDFGQSKHTALSRAQIIELAEGGLIEVGSHSMTHPTFSALSVPAQRAEVESSKSRLEEILARPVTSFAYPFGSKLDYTKDTADAVERAGYVCACANFPAVVTSASDRFQLPRFLVRDWDGEEFGRRLGAWLGG